MKKCRRVWLRVLVSASLLLALTTVFWANHSSAQQTPESRDRQLYNYLRTVINAGADLYNQQGNFKACHDLYRGSLTTVRPLLSHHAELQRAIDTGLAKADKEKNIIGKAFVLRRVLGAVRSGLRKSFAPEEKLPPIEKKKPPVEKKKPPKGKKTPPKDKNGKSKENKKPAPDQARVSGKVTFQGKAVPIGYVTFHGANGRSFATYIERNGSYSLKTPVPPGKYKVTVELAPDPVTNAPLPNAPKLPARYENPATSGIVVDLASGKNERDFNLSK